METGSLFRLPDEAFLTPLLQQFPCREHQIRSLATLLHPDGIPCRNVVLHGTEATGKTAITSHLLSSLTSSPPTDQTASDAVLPSSPSSSSASLLRHAIVNCAQCITGRHLFERVVGAVADALPWDARPRRCETLAQLAVELSGMLKYPVRDPRWRFVLVLDSVDRQRDAPPTLLPALARLSEIIPCLTCVFIATAPPATFPRTPSTPHLHFPPYAKPDFVRILALAPPQPPLAGTSSQETADLWARFCAAVHDSLVRPASRSLPACRQACLALWPRFAAPVAAGTYAPREFSKILIAARTHFQDESLLNPSIVSARPGKDALASGHGAAAAATNPSKPPASAVDLIALLPIAARLLLLASYLASHNAARHDLTLFSTYHHGRKRRRGGFAGGGSRASAAKHRKIARKLLGAHAFVLERMMAIFAAVRGEWCGDGGSAAAAAAALDADLGMAVATLSSLRLLVRVGGATGGDPMDRGGKWRVNVGWEVIRGVGRSIGVEVEEWLIE